MSKKALSSLVVNLEVQTAELRKGLDRASKNVEGFSQKASKAGKAVAAVFSIGIAKQAVGGLARFVQSGAQAADTMGKLAASVGAPVEQLSKLGYAAELSGSNTQQLGVAMRQLSTKMLDASSGSASQAAIFERLGVAVTDASGQMRDSGEVFGDIADKFASMEDGAEKTALAAKLFGEEGTKLIPMLNAGRDGLREMGDEAERYGLVISEQGANASAAFNDSLTKLSKAGEGLATRVAQELAPALTQLSDGFLKSKEGASALDGAAEALSTGMRILASGGSLIAGIFNALGKTLAGVAASVIAVFTGEFRQAIEILDALGEELAKTAKETADQQKAIWTKAKGVGDWAEDQAKRARRAAGTQAQGSPEAEEFAVHEIVGRLPPSPAAQSAGPLDGVLESLAHRLDPVLGAFASGGPIAGMVEILSSSKQFAALSDAVTEVVLSVSDAFGTLIEPLIPLVQATAPLAVAIKALLVPFTALLDIAIKPLTHVIKAVVGFIVGTVKLIADAVNGVAWLLGLGNPWDTSSLDAAMRDLSDTGREASDAQADLAETTRELNTALSNVAETFKVDLARWRAAETGGGSGGGGSLPDLGPVDLGDFGDPRGPGGRPIGGGRQRPINVTVMVGNKEVAAVVKEEFEADSFLRSGNAFAGSY